MWRALPSEGRVAVCLAQLALATLALAVARGRRLSNRGRITAVASVAVFTQIAWLCTAPRAEVVQANSFSPASELSELSKFTPGELLECENASSAKPSFSSSRRVCVSSCLSGGGCYPRVRGFCVSKRRASACSEFDSAIDFAEWHVHTGDRGAVKLPITHEKCDLGFHSTTVEKKDSRVKWHRGLSVVLDAVFQDAETGHLYHELEKLLASLHLTGAFDSDGRKHDALSRARVFWFASRRSVSKVTESVLNEYFAETLQGTSAQMMNAKTIDFIELRDDDREWCFEEAVIVRSGFGSLTPGKTATNALRRALMPACGLDPSAEVTRGEISSLQALVFDRAAPRSFRNRKALVAQLRSALGGVEVRTASSSLSTCEQMKIVSDADVIVTPHGSQHALFLFAKRRAIIVEVQPYLYFNPEDILFLPRSGMGFRVYESMGLPDFTSWPTHRIFSNFGWRDCMASHACRARTRKAPVIDNVTDVLEFIRRISDASGSFARRGEFPAAASPSAALAREVY